MDQRLVGREREVLALSAWLDAALDGRPRLVLCGGEPGIGKTRLATELVAMARAREVPTRWARAQEGAGSPPYWLWRQVLGSGDERRAPELSALVSGAEGGLDVATRRFELFDRVARRLFGEAEASGLVVVLDDLHWADQPSLLLLRHVACELHQARLMFLATHRTVAAGATQGWPAVLPDLLTEPVTEQIHLRGLSVEATTRCVSAVVDGPVSESLGRRVHGLTGGNPFFAQELGRARLASGADDADDAAIVPMSVLEVVGQRLERLSPDTRRILTAAAVVGEQFPIAVAASLIGRPVTSCLHLLEEASEAGLLEAAAVPGDWRFTHALVRDAVEARTSVAERVDLHRGAAEAIERTYAGQLDVRAADLARHWVAVAVTGERDKAVEWSRRAAENAMSALAYEESARLYRLALDAGGPDIEEAARCQLLVDLASAHWRSGELGSCLEACRESAERARRIGRPDLVGEAALRLEPVGTLAWDLDIRLWCEEALSGLGEAEPSLRARLLARLTEASIYLGEDSAADRTSRLALELADQSGDVTAVVAALRSRQLALSGPEHVAERGVLADRMVGTGVVLRRPDVEMWGRLWKVDTSWEQGDLSSVGASLGRLEWSAQRVGGPVARWHLLVTRAGLAQGLGHLAEALELGRDAFECGRACRNPSAFGAYMSLLCAVGHHAGHDRAGTIQMLAGPEPAPVDPGEVRAAIFGHLGPALVLAETGRLEEAAAAYRRVGPVEGWRPPPYFRVLSWAVGSIVAVALGERADVEILYQRLQVERGRHGVGGAGNASYLGPVELHLGRMEAFLGRLDDAEAHLSSAASCCQAIGAEGFRAEADCELAELLALRGGVGDRARAQALACSAEATATRLGMAPWAARAAGLASAARSAATSGGLSRREMEVAELVARGRTNREIATALFVSERTAQTHVQHILAKLGFSKRSQIASWVTSASRSGGHSGAGVNT